VRLGEALREALGEALRDALREALREAHREALREALREAAPLTCECGSMAILRVTNEPSVDTSCACRLMLADTLTGPVISTRSRRI
jgi:hypothetical protein